MTRPDLTDRITAFTKLGEIMSGACHPVPQNSYSRKLNKIASAQIKKNHWFTPGSVFQSIKALSQNLNRDSLVDWVAGYNIPETNSKPKIIGVIMAGNIPLVGFHDFLSVLITGNIFIGKTSSKDRELISVLAQVLIEIEPRLRAFIEFKEDNISECAAIIATGSNNSFRYFEYSYGQLPHIFRKNRNSVAIVDPDITEQELADLGNDVFDYFGLGCRNVSKIYIPVDFDTERFKIAWKSFLPTTNIEPYRSNINYQRALYITEGKAFIDLDNLLLINDGAISSPVSVLNYSYYDNIENVITELALNAENIQVIIGREYLGFGASQSPCLSDYADGIDTIDFLRNLL